MNNQRIMTLTAKSLFKYFPKKTGQENKSFCFDTRKRTLYTLVVKAENDMDDCPLFYQFMEVLKADKTRKKIDENKRYSLYDQFLIMDFEDIFLPLKENPTDAAKKRKETLLNNAKDIIENGFDIIFDEDITVHMRPFDKSGNMSRHARISFVNEVYVKDLNKRLNLGIDFSEMKVKLSKYYAYRGLYLSTAQRVELDGFELTPETLVIVKDKRLDKKGNNIRNDYKRDALIATAKQGKNPGEWEFEKPEKKDLEEVDIPHDGVGLITEDYAEYINVALGIEGATSFQIRLPFAKGMLHQVDVCGFIDEYSEVGKGEKQYIYDDPFGIERDLKKAKIFMTESMFKGQGWLVEHCNKHNIKDPVQFYCDMINKYNHALYVSGTNLPYGHSKYTHLSYQTINTLALDQEQFERIIEGHGKFIENPVDYIRTCSEREEDRIENEDSVEDENSVEDEDVEVAQDSVAEEESIAEDEGIIKSTLKNWENAIIRNPDFAKDKYISEQLKNTQKSLLTKIATGKILVEGQTRFLCRDLVALLSGLLREDADVKGCFYRYLFSRFYMPFGKGVKTNLEFDKCYAFFRNPHLSRNEQYIDIAFVMPKSKEDYAKDGRKEYDDYVKYIAMYDKYFGHLTGIVMVPRGSTLPLCLGGADFDGDLVSVIFNQDVVDAVKRGVYKENYSPSLNYFTRKVSGIKIPTSKVDEEFVPEYVSYKHIFNTFSNYIGQISNAAISIGQEEYGRKGYVEEIEDVHKPSCAKCTLLTGLEIDAAKNGIHPNLDIILKTGIKKSGYLDFLRDFRKLKVEEKFHYETLEVSKEKKEINGVECETGVNIFAVKNCDTVVRWDTDLEKEGTYINLIPYYFLRYLQTYKELKSSGSEKKKEQNEMLIKQERLGKEETISIKAFQKSCEEIFKIYMFYKRFLKELTKEKNKGYYAVENAEIHIMRMYDEEYADKKLFETLLGIREKIAAVISEDSQIGEIRERINTEQWQYQPMEQRALVLEKVIGNGFKASDLDKEESELLYHFNQQGYKFLWRIMDLIEGPRIKTYEEMYNKQCEKVKKVFVEEFENLDNTLYQELMAYYENNTINVSQLIYVHTLSELKRVISIYMETGIAKSKLIASMYKKTRSNLDKAKFFWDVFSWDELKDLIKDKEDKKNVK